MFPKDGTLNSYIGSCHRGGHASVGSCQAFIPAAASYPHIFLFFVSICNAAYLHTSSGFQSVRDSALIPGCQTAPNHATACFVPKDVCEGHYWV